MKKLLVLAVMLAFAVSFVGCNQAGDEPAPGTAPVETAPVEEAPAADAPAVEAAPEAEAEATEEGGFDEFNYQQGGSASGRATAE